MGEHEGWVEKKFKKMLNCEDVNMNAAVRGYVVEWLKLVELFRRQIRGIGARNVAERWIRILLVYFKNRFTL